MSEKEYQTAIGGKCSVVYISCLIVFMSEQRIIIYDICLK